MTLFRALLLALLALIAGSALAENRDPQSDDFWFGTAADGSPTVRLYYFYSPTCPHCQAAKPLVNDFAARTPWLELQAYPVKDNRDNARFYFNTAKALGVEALSVPGFVFCRQVRIGYDSAETTGAELIQALEQCHADRLAHPQAAAAGTTSMQGTSGGARDAEARVRVRRHECCHAVRRSIGECRSGVRLRVRRCDSEGKRVPRRTPRHPTRIEP